MKIVGIVGALDLPGSDRRNWRRIRSAFKEQYPESEFVVEHELYLPWQFEKLRALAGRVLAKHDSGEDILLIGFSLGGVVACSIAPRFVKSTVIGVVTVGAPHLAPFYRSLHAQRKPLNMPVLTFGGILDLFVPWFITSYPDNIHANIFSDHWALFFLSPQPARIIARQTKRALDAAREVIH